MVLQIMNFVVLGIFIGSVSYVALNYRDISEEASSNKSPLTSMFFPLMVLWSGCLAYFFGFFGISFVDKDALEPSAVENTDSAASAHQPRHDTPICSEIAMERLRKEAEVQLKREKAIASAPVVEENTDFSAMDNEQVLDCLLSGSLKDYQLEKKLGDYERAVDIRRGLYENLLQKSLDTIPYAPSLDYNKVGR
jgi:hypothetical protein